MNNILPGCSFAYKSYVGLLLNKRTLGEILQVGDGKQMEKQGCSIDKIISSELFYVPYSLSLVSVIRALIL